jgi:hypothetical protein
VRCRCTSLAFSSARNSAMCKSVASKGQVALGNHQPNLTASSSSVVTLSCKRQRRDKRIDVLSSAEATSGEHPQVRIPDYQKVYLLIVTYFVPISAVSTSNLLILSKFRSKNKLCSEIFGTIKRYTF